MRISQIYIISNRQNREHQSSFEASLINPQLLLYVPELVVYFFLIELVVEHKIFYIVWLRNSDFHEGISDIKPLFLLFY